MENPSLFKKILIADDEAELLDSLSKAFKKNGWEVGLAADGKEALGLISKDRFPLVLSDIDMPGMNGVELLDHIRKSKIKTRVIFMTGKPSYELLKAGVEKGIVNYIEKPFRTFEVIKRAEDVFSAHIEEANREIEITNKREQLRNIKHALGRAERMAEVPAKNYLLVITILALVIIALIVIMAVSYVP